MIDLIFPNQNPSHPHNPFFINPNFGGNVNGSPFHVGVDFLLFSHLKLFLFFTSQFPKVHLGTSFHLLIHHPTSVFTFSLIVNIFGSNMQHNFTNFLGFTKVNPVSLVSPLSWCTRTTQSSFVRAMRIITHCG